MSDEKSLKKDAKDVKNSAVELGRSVDKFFKNGNDQVIGPAATKALVEGKKLVDRVKDRLFGRDHSE